jgi:DNA-binding XRE family transcriptional regulator
MRIPPGLREEFLETGALFRRGRRYLDMTQEEVAEFLDVSSSKITELELQGGQMVYRLAMKWMLENPDKIPGRKCRDIRETRKEGGRNHTGGRNSGVEKTMGAWGNTCSPKFFSPALAIGADFPLHG